LAIKSIGVDTEALSQTYPADLGAVALCYVAGFVILFAPGGLGVREYVLMKALTPRFGIADTTTAEGLAIVIALLLRLVWTIGEVLVALSLFFIKPRNGN
jgi:uncharacterized membrane protein YbhN (UPF0104 family)